MPDDRPAEPRSSSRDGLVEPPEAELRRWLPPLPADDARHPRRTAENAATWNGVVWGRLGRGDLAWSWWDSVEDPQLQPWIAAERGRLLREAGLHERAKELEEEGLRAATDLVDVVMLRLSLAADHVGLGSLVIARSALEGASDMLDELPDGARAGRQRLRRTWVRTELALADGLPSDGKALPWIDVEGQLHFPADHAHGTDFHRAKGLLFAAVAIHEPRMLVEAAALAPPALRWAIELARLDAGDDRAAGRAVAAWRAVTVPPVVAGEVARGATARRIATLA